MNIHKNRTNISRRVQSKSSQSRSFDERRKRRVVIGTIAGTLAFASWMFVFYRVSSLPSLAITEVRVSGADPSVTGHLEAAAYGALTGSYLGVFSKANGLLYPEGSVASAVTHASPEIQNVSVERTGMNTLTVSVSQKTPAAIACAGLPNFDDSGALVQDLSSGDCYYADASGFMFKKADATTSSDYLRYYVPDVAVQPSGQYATTTQSFAALQSFLDGARTGGMKPEGLLIKEDGEYELYIANPDKSVAIVYFDDAGVFATELSNLSAFWNTMVRAKAAPSSFEYIDVRYGSNVFYRLIQ